MQVKGTARLTYDQVLGMLKEMAGLVNSSAPMSPRRASSDSQLAERLPLTRLKPPRMPSGKMSSWNNIHALSNK